MAGHELRPSILREYDIRGIVGDTLTAKDAFFLGCAYGTVLTKEGGRSVALGQDGRLSSPALANALAWGLASAGLEVARVGLGPTPMLYFAEKYLVTDGAIMVTGSHNPAEYNGFKMVMRGGSVYGAGIRRLAEIARSGAFAVGSGRVVRRPVIDGYVERLLRDVDMARPLKVAWDPGNGAAGPIVTRLTQRLPGRHIVINGKVDGTFPAHHPDPTQPETLEQLKALVLTQQCDLGIAFDGDGDRIGVIDSAGRILWGDQLMVFYAEEILRRRPDATFIADVKASQVLFDEVGRMGGTALMWRTGHSLIKAKMAETGAALAGEMSGHIFFADGYYGYDDALYAALRLLNIVSRAEGGLAGLNDRLPKMVNTPELRFQCSDERKFTVIEEVKARLARAGADVEDIDGVRVKTADGWWLLRASNTQDVLVARCESASTQGLTRLQSALADQLAASALALPGKGPKAAVQARPAKALSSSIA